MLRTAKDVLKPQARALLSWVPETLGATLLTIHKYRHTFGYYPNLLFPTTFNEKVQARKFRDNRAIYKLWVDKLAVRDYVHDRSPSLRMPELYHVTDDPSDIPFDRLPDRYVVKASHGSGWVHVVIDSSTVDRDALISRCQSWLEANYFRENLETMYRDIPPRIMIEEFLDNGFGMSAEDLKFYVFGGKVQFIQIDVDRFGTHRRNIYDASWNLLPVRLTVQNYDSEIKRPSLLNEMVQYAESLSGGVDFVRVDLYAVGQDSVYFGEMTPSSGNGFNTFSPASYDEVFGSFWKMRTPGRRNGTYRSSVRRAAGSR